MVDRTDPRPAILISGRNEEARAIVCAEVERRYSDDYPVAGATSPEAGREELRRLAGEGEVAAVLTTLDDHDSDAFDFLAAARRISPANLPRDRDPLGEVGNGIGHLRSAGRRGHGLLSHFRPSRPATRSSTGPHVHLAAHVLCDPGDLEVADAACGRRSGSPLGPGRPGDHPSGTLRRVCHPGGPGTLACRQGGRDVKTFPLDRAPYSNGHQPAGVFAVGDVRRGSVKRSPRGAFAIQQIHGI